MRFLLGHRWPAERLAGNAIWQCMAARYRIETMSFSAPWRGPTKIARMKARIAAVAVITLLTLSVIAVGFSELAETRDAEAANASSAEPTQDGGDNAAVSTFKYVCPFH